MWKGVLIATHLQPLYIFCFCIFAQIFSKNSWSTGLVDFSLTAKICWLLLLLLAEGFWGALTSESIHSDWFLLIGQMPFFSLVKHCFCLIFVLFFTIEFSPWDIDQNHWSLVLVSPMARWSQLLSNALVSFFLNCCIVCFKCQSVGRQFCSGDDGRPEAQSDL